MTDTSRLPVLDGLRALAILLVMAMHVMIDVDVATGWPVSVAGSEHAARFLLNGWSGVQLFFVLSGFLIAGQLLDPRLLDPARRKDFIRNYYIRRFMRIAPPYYLVLTAAFLLEFNQAYQAGFPADSKTPGSLAWRYAYHLAFLQDYLPPDFGAVFWTLAVEAQFYLLAPFLVMALMRFAEKRYLTMAGLIAALLVIKTAVMLHFPPDGDHEIFFRTVRSPFHMALDGLLTGVLARLLWQDERLRPRLAAKRAASLLFLAGTVLFLLLTVFVRPYYSDPPDMVFFTGTIYFPLISGSFMLMMLGLLGGSVGSRLFEAKIWRGIAAISYSLYLIHTLFTKPLVNAAIAMLGAGAGPGTLWCAGFILLLLACIPCAAVLYRFWEKPMIDRARRITGAAA